MFECSLLCLPDKKLDKILKNIKYHKKWDYQINISHLLLHHLLRVQDYNTNKDKEFNNLRSNMGNLIIPLQINILHLISILHKITLPQFNHHLFKLPPFNQINLIIIQMHLIINILLQMQVKFQIINIPQVLVHLPIL